MICPICRPRRRGGNGHAPFTTPDLLSKHFDHGHALCVSVLQQEPRPYEVCDTFELNGRWHCRGRGGAGCANTYGRKYEADAHWKKKHRLVEFEHGKVLLGCNMPLAQRPTAADSQRAAMHDAGVDFPRDDDPDAAHPRHVWLAGAEKPLKRVREFRYLGRIMSDDNRDDKAIRTRINIADTTFRLLHKKALRGALRATKIKVWDSIVAAQVLYGAETWVPSTKAKAALDRFQQRSFRHLLGMHPVWLPSEERINYPPKYKVLRAAGRPLLSDKVDHASLRFYGHLLRRPDNDDAKFLVRARIAGLHGRQAIARPGSLPERMQDLAAAAGINTDVPATRATWRRANNARLAKLAVRAQSAFDAGNGADAGDG